MITIFLLRARWRVWRGRCPACNSNGDYCCICCEYDRSTDGPLAELTKFEWLKKYKEELRCR